MVIGRGTRLLAAGTALGVASSLAVGRSVASVWRVGAVDPVALAAVAALLLLVGLQACYWPARRAARTDPLVALRELH
jgi:ABC-type lipoprotein release transport system permease subunit